VPVVALPAQGSRRPPEGGLDVYRHLFRMSCRCSPSGFGVPEEGLEHAPAAFWAPEVLGMKAR